MSKTIAVKVNVFKVQHALGSSSLLLSALLSSSLFSEENLHTKLQQLLNIMISTHYISIICFFSAVFLLVESQIISAPVGSTVILPCQWRNITVQTPHVQWSTLFETVFERKGVKMYEGEGYENRVDVPQDNLLKGNCSLVLMNVRLLDTGVYESYMSVKRRKRASTTKWVLLESIELSVYEKPEEIQHDISYSRAEESFYKRLIAGAGVKSHQPHVILISLLLCLCLLHF
ncbi:uncharacterized protein LOC124392989 [Silurus meridionalis]|uniref:uncharacterized protein LOC124392989 n=1 Tax=Silurus meridionalis TaxID=175797 RepID=UPI001EECBB78|nr:uncharacterized protein LOC124392989 [Silurus meridionalis]